MFDTHVHIASDDPDRYPRMIGGLGSEWWRRGGHGVDGLLRAMDGSGVERASVVQAVGVYGFDNTYLLDAVGEHRDRLSAVVCLDMVPGVGSDIAAIAERDGVVGVRMFAVGAPGSGMDRWVGAEVFDESMDACRASGLTAVLTVFQHHLAVLIPALVRWADVPVALDHCGFPVLDGAVAAARQPVHQLVGQTNVHLKVSSHLLQHAPDPAAFIADLSTRFGAARLLWGSDYPQSGDGYADLVALAPDAVAACAETASRLFWS